MYILQCNDGTLYTGYASDLQERVKKHNLGVASKYTRSRRPVKVVYYECLTGKSAAMKREKAVKDLSRKEKLRLINSFNLSGVSIQCTKI